MSTSTILNITEVAENQNNKHLTINEMLAALEEATQAKLTVDMTAGTKTLTVAELTRSFLFDLANVNSAGLDLKIPYTVNSVSTQRFFAVRNATANDVRVITSNAVVGTSVTVIAGTTAFIYAAGADMISLGAIGTGIPFTFAAFVPGLPPGSAAEIYRIIMVENVSFADNFTGSKGTFSVLATADTAFPVQKNGSTIGTVTYKTDGTVVFATSGTGNETFNAGDVLSILGPAVQDATLANIGMTFKGNRL